jgi:DNA-directed RNA polymerase specialized sigma24 family protein
MGAVAMGTTMSCDEPVTRLIALLKKGDRDAAQRLWEIYFRRLVGLASARLASAPSPVADAEDVALSAFHSFFRRAESGKFPHLEDRDDLWQLLFVLTVRKAVNLVRYQGRRSRGSGRVVSLTDLESLGTDLALGDEPSPELAAEMVDQCRHLLDLLPDATLRAVALWKMEGFTNGEIATKLGCVEKTVERKLRAIRDFWTGGASS